MSRVENKWHDLKIEKSQAFHDESAHQTRTQYDLENLTPVMLFLDATLDLLKPFS